MTIPAKPDGTPDVDAILRDLREILRDSGESAGSAEAAGPPRSLDGLLAALNQSYEIGRPAGKGWRACRDRLARSVAGGLVAQVNAVHALTVQTLNRMADALAGRGEEYKGGLAAEAARRRDLLEQIASRLAALERQDLDQRLRALERPGEGEGRETRS